MSERKRDATGRGTRAREMRAKGPEGNVSGTAPQMGANLHISNHPVALDAVRVLRDRTTGTDGFWAAMERLGSVLAVESLKDLPTEPTEIETPLAATRVPRLARPLPVLVPVLRAGLGLLAPFRALLPASPVGMIGVVRGPDAEPMPYLERLPTLTTPGQPVIVLDPMLATGGSASFALGRLAEMGVRGPDTILVVAIAVPEGVARVRTAMPGLRVVAGAIDPRLNDRQFIVPGLGDAGDRLFGTPATEN